MKASIVVCSYNQGQYLGDALESLTRQTGLAAGELEIIVVDGMSTDNSGDVISRYRSQLDIVVREPDQGQADAIRKGFRLATGDIFGWLCSDDLLEPTTVREVLDYFHASPETRFLYGDAVFISAGGRVTWGWPHHMSAPYGARSQLGHSWHAGIFVRFYLMSAGTVYGHSC